MWKQRIHKLLETGSELRALHNSYDEQLIPEAWTHDVLGIRQHLAAHGEKWWRFLIGDFRRAKNDLAGLCQKPLPKRTDDRLALTDAILQAQRFEKIIYQQEEVGSTLFGVHWQSVDSDWPVLKRIAEWVFNLHEQVEQRELPRELIAFLSGNPDPELIEPLVIETEQALTQQAAASDEVERLIELNPTIRFDNELPLRDQSFEEQRELYATCISETDSLQDMVSYNHLAEAMYNDELALVVRLADRWPHSGMYLADALQFNWLNSLIERTLREHELLAGFDGASHGQLVRTFRELDRAVLHYNQARLAQKHWDSLPRQSVGGQMGVLRREFEKRRSHLPIRQLMERAGNAIQKIKPVFMMSPMSIAMYLPPGSVSFDLVIFDEASQVKPVDAFGAILRGRQVVVVGDSKQLPPTSFFDNVVADEIDDSTAADMESVLGLFNAQGAPERMLRWHYRSRHDSLIAVSNREFYDSRLVTFPSPDGERHELGLRYHHHGDTYYDRGGSRTNKGEACVVAEAVMEHARKQPGQSLGVAAFSQAQAEAIQNQLELLRRQDSSCEPFFNGHTEEPFFIKNLENVQGDERDVIFISIGYGKDQYGNLSMNFGPLNQDGGERRLNVLITRARRRCEIFTNLQSDDIDLTRTSARGVVALKRYLQYAESGKMEMDTPTDRGADSVFEEQVADAIRKHGYQVQHQVGSAGYFVDLGVIDPEKPGRYLLGIECDGATYHSGRTARDRDRIRQQVLEGLGWQLHRIWSTDWFRNPERELRRTLEAINAAKTRKARNNNIPVNQRPASQTLVREDVTSKPDLHDLPVAAYQIKVLSPQSEPEGGLHQESVAHLASLFREVVLTESPVHFEEASRRILAAYNVLVPM